MRPARIREDFPQPELPTTATNRCWCSESSRSISSRLRPKNKIVSSLWNRSEERRVGKECRARWSPDHEKKNKKEKEWYARVMQPEEHGRRYVISVATG